MTEDNYKGTGAVFVRSFVRSRGPEAEARLLAKLSPEDAERYLRTLAFDWIPIATISRIFEAAAPLAFPGNADAMRLLGREMARDHLRGIYRFLLRITTVAFVMTQTARLWSTYHRKGVAHLAENTAPNMITLVVSDYPELPDRFRECMCGYIVGTIELVGVQEIRVHKLGDASSQWQWRISWK